VRLESLGERVRARRCGPALCFESVVEPGNFLATEWDSRLVWRSGCGLNHENFFRCSASLHTPGILEFLHLNVRSSLRGVCREVTLFFELSTGSLCGARKMIAGMEHLHRIGLLKSNLEYTSQAI